VTPRHRRGDKVVLVGKTTVKYAQCVTCRERAEQPGDDRERGIWWREHREAAS